MYGLGCCCRQLVKYVSTFSVVVAAGMSDCTTALAAGVKEGDKEEGEDEGMEEGMGGVPNGSQQSDLWSDDDEEK